MALSCPDQPIYISMGDWAAVTLEYFHPLYHEGCFKIILSILKSKFSFFDFQKFLKLTILDNGNPTPPLFIDTRHFIANWDWSSRAWVWVKLFYVAVWRFLVVVCITKRTKLWKKKVKKIMVSAFCSYDFFCCCWRKLL